MTDCIVVGGGLIGMLTARFLNEAGVNVMVLEQGGMGQESSWAGGGILSPLYPWRYPEPVNRLAAYSQPRYESLCQKLYEETGIDPEWTRSGLLMLSPEDAREGIEWSKAAGSEMQLVEPDQVQELEPGLQGETAGSLWMPQIAQLRNPRMAQSLRRGLELKGVSLREQVRVTGLVVKDGRVAGVSTDTGSVMADQVLVAGGAWSAQLIRMVTGPIPVEPVRGQMVLFKTEPDVLKRIVLDQGRYLIPRRDGHILMGSTVEYVGFDKRTTEAAREELIEAAINRVPALKYAEVERHWAGLRPGSPDGIPFIGPHPEIEGLHVNTGHFRNGVIMGLASAQLAANLMLGQEPVVDPEPYLLKP
ncbi:MAG: glycine oxidase ThiO [Gammaproteobacteria bacterium]|nr:glycine oxidase ThiO [Gammaproteobacteria bacterium]